MEKKKLRLIHLHQTPGVTRPLIRKMLQMDPSLKSVYLYSASQLSKYFSISMKRSQQIHAILHDKTNISSLVQDLKKYSVITIFDVYYPPLLKVIKDPPLVLYFCGKKDWFYQIPALSVVGTRSPSAEAKKKMEYILSPLIRNNWVIVSGMAKGIDGYAHHLALNNNGKTIAVLGSGFNYIYPQEHIDLFHQLLEKQLVVSEYPPNMPPRRYHFPERNRIISGLGFGTIVIEAKQKSGSLITVDQALDQGREVFAVPGSPLNGQTSGCHKMIQDGAKLVQNTQDLLEEWENLEVKWCRFMSEWVETRLF